MTPKKEATAIRREMVDFKLAVSVSIADLQQRVSLLERPKKSVKPKGKVNKS